MKDLRAGTLPTFAVVITYDDGFDGNFLHGLRSTAISGCRQRFT